MCGLPFPSPGHLPTQRLSLHLLHWQADSLPQSHLGNPSLSFLSSSSIGWLTHMHRAIASAQAHREAAPKCFLLSVQLCLNLQIRVPLSSPAPSQSILQSSLPTKGKKKKVAQIKKKVLGAGQTFQDSAAGAAREQDYPYKRGRTIGLSTQLVAFPHPKAQECFSCFPLWLG